MITGYLWDVPMCVQPMKSIAAVALTDVGAGSSAGASGLDAQSVTTAGILTGAAVLLLGVTNLMEVVNWIVPLTVVCGLQIGVGLRLASKGMTDIQKLNWGGGYDCIALALACSLFCMYWLRDNEKGGNGNKGGVVQRNERNNRSESFTNGGDENEQIICCGREMDCDSRLDGDNKEEHLQLNDGVEMGNVMTTASASITPSQPQSPSSSTIQCVLRQLWNRTCCFLHPFPKTPHPVGIYLFLIGSLFAAITLATAPSDSEDYDLPLHFFGAPIAINALEGVTALHWRQGFLQGTLPQLPLTTLNSVISVCCLAHSLYPEKRDPVLAQKGRTDAVITRRDVSISVGLMNLLLCPLGSMPNCHGAGGLAGQHRFGARHGTSVAILGAFKMFLAIFLGGSALTLLDALPVAVLGVMLVIAGLELVGTGVSMLMECVTKEETKMEERMDLGHGSESNSKDVNAKKKIIMRKNTLIAMVTAGVIVALQKTHYGAISGWIVHMIYGDGFLDLLAWIQTRRQAKNSGRGE